MLTGILSCARLLSSASSDCSVARARPLASSSIARASASTWFVAGLEIRRRLMPAHSRSTAFWNVPGSLLSSAHASLMLMCIMPMRLLARAGDAHQRVGDALAIGGELDAAEAGGQARQADQVARRQSIEQRLRGAQDGCGSTPTRRLPSSTTNSSRRPVVAVSFEVEAASRGVAGVVLVGTVEMNCTDVDRPRLAVDLELEVGRRQRRRPASRRDRRR